MVDRKDPDQLTFARRHGLDQPVGHPGRGGAFGVPRQPFLADDHQRVSFFPAQMLHLHVGHFGFIDVVGGGAGAVKTRHRNVVHRQPPDRQGPSQRCNGGFVQEIIVRPPWRNTEKYREIPRNRETRGWEIWLVQTGSQSVKQNKQVGQRSTVFLKKGEYM